MAQVTARNTAQLSASPQQVAELLADYHRRPELQPENYSAFRIVSGGVGDGTVAAWHLQATKKRSRDVEVSVATAGSVDAQWTLTETDANSSMVTVYTVSPAGQGCTVEVVTSWNGAGGIGGIFEGIFAPGGMRRIQQAQLERLVELLA